MKGTLLFSTLVGFLSLLNASAQEAATNSPAVAPARIKASEARAHIGSEVVVSGTIAEVNRAERLVRLNFGRPFPNQQFTAVIFADKTNLFPEVEKLQGQSAEVSGKITVFRSRPEIVISSTNQLKLATPQEKEAATGKK